MARHDGESNVLFPEFGKTAGEREASRVREGFGAELARRAESIGEDPEEIVKRYDDVLPLIPDLFERSIGIDLRHRVSESFGNRSFSSFAWLRESRTLDKAMPIVPSEPFGKKGTHSRLLARTRGPSPLR